MVSLMICGVTIETLSHSIVTLSYCHTLALSVSFGRHLKALTVQDLQLYIESPMAFSYDSRPLERRS